MSKADCLGDRMKWNYEDRYRIFLTRRTPVIIRLDGKAFHTFTRGCDRPFDLWLMNAMSATTKALMENIQGAKMAYTQSDEINILVTDFDKLTTDAWFDYNVQKMCSVAASMATAHFNSAYQKGLAYFDARVFNIPNDEVVNLFRWRYQDWVRNSIQMVGRSLFSHKELHQKNQNQIKEMCEAKGVRWEDLPPISKNGTLMYMKYPEGLVIDEDYNMRKAEFVSFVNTVMEQSWEGKE
jgi:tRNA(His) guanylyltransferase